MEASWSAAVDPATGVVSSLEMDLVFDGGCNGYGGDAQMGLQWSDNTYKHADYDCKTSVQTSGTAGNAACRAPGVIQSIPVHELVLELVAETTGLSPEAVREANFYSAGDETPYGYKVGTKDFNWTIPALWPKAKAQWKIAKRRTATAAFNAANVWRKRGLSMLPIKYGMLGTAGGAYQIASSVRILAGDATVHVVHGGCELGQGIHTKVAQAVAYALGCPIASVAVGATSALQAPNSTSTGGSGTSESSVRSVLAACDKLNATLKPYRAEGASWAKAVEAAAAAGVELNASGWANVDTPATFACDVWGCGGGGRAGCADRRGGDPARRPAHGPGHAAQPRCRSRPGGGWLRDGARPLPFGGGQVEPRGNAAHHGLLGVQAAGGARHTAPTQRRVRGKIAQHRPACDAPLEGIG